MTGFIRHGILAAALSFGLAAGPAAWAASEGDSELWKDLAYDLYGDQTLKPGDEVLALEAPYRAHDAAIVPITIKALIPQTEARYIKTITLVVDENPAPVAAVFHLGPNSGLVEIATRVRVNAYTDIHAVAEMSDGALHVVKRFVKAAGGCSAPALQDQEEAIASLGKMKLKALAKPEEAAQMSTRWRTAQLMIRHPNYSGLQKDQITQYFIPAHFVREIEVRQGDETIMKVEGAISLSEDPNITFNYIPNGAETLTVRAIDTDDNVFEKTWPVATDSGV